MASPPGPPQPICSGSRTNAQTRARGARISTVPESSTGSSLDETGEVGRRVHVRVRARHVDDRDQIGPGLDQRADAAVALELPGEIECRAGNDDGVRSPTTAVAGDDDRPLRRLSPLAERCGDRGPYPGRVAAPDDR